MLDVCVGEMLVTPRIGFYGRSCRKEEEGNSKEEVYICGEG